MKPERLNSPKQIALQKYLARQCYWDEDAQLMWIDCRKVWPKTGVVCLISWDRMLLDSDPVPHYPPELNVFEWSSFSELAYWRKQIPKWVQESCALFPSHQLTLLHYCGKYPQLLELLDHAPLLAWRLVTSGLEEPEIVALLSGRRVEMATQVGWPGREETVRFLRNLRLRWVDQQISEQVETCLLDTHRLEALQSLPRINSMALSLAARFPELIGCRLHQSLARLPCRPMQCQSMIALLEDVYRFAERHGLDEEEVAKIGNSRYLVEVSELYQEWLKPVLGEVLRQGDAVEALLVRLAESKRAFERLTTREEWAALSRLLQHDWLSDYQSGRVLIAWYKEDKLYAALIEDGEAVRVRGEDNTLPEAAALSDLHLWLATDKL